MTSLVVSTTLVSNNFLLIADALRSVVSLVDACLIIDTGSTDQTLDVARRVVGDKLLIKEFPWRDDFAAARNFALQSAAELGFDWALTLDSDERIRLNGSPDELRQFLGNYANMELWLARDSSFGYCKERLIRLPSQRAWMGRTHEYLDTVVEANRSVLSQLSFYEVPKLKEDMHVKLHRDVRILKEETEASPGNARWWYFLGQTLEQLDQVEEAIVAYQKTIDLSKWPEEVAWSAFCLARCEVRRANYLTALRVCSQGLQLFRYSPELAWLAGKCALKMTKLPDAIHWSELAIALAESPETENQRLNFRHLPAWFESPYNVLRIAYEESGRAEDAKRAAAKFAEAIQARKRVTDHGISGH